MPLPVSSSSDGSRNIYQVKRCRRPVLRRWRGNASRPQKGGPSLITPIDTKPRVSSLLRSRWLFVSTPIRVSPRGAAHLRYTHRPSLKQHPAARPVSAPSLSLSPTATGCMRSARWSVVRSNSRERNLETLRLNLQRRRGFRHLHFVRGHLPLLGYIDGARKRGGGEGSSFRL